MKKIFGYVSPLIGLLFLLAGIPGFRLIYDATQNLTVSIVITVLYELVVLIGGFMGKVWQRLGDTWADRLANDIDLDLQSAFSRYRRRYLEYLVFQNRSFDVKGLSTQGPYNLELEGVYVQLNVDPNTPQGVTANPLQGLPEHLHSGSHSIWQYLSSRNPKISNYAILGAPGCGKTTLLKHMALTLAAPANRRRKLDAPHLLPILLFLREHSQAIKDNPSIPLAQLIRDQFQNRQAPLPPTGWLEKHLKNGKCLIMMDGLDEVADIPSRKQVVAWVEKCMVAYAKNRFVLSSRPHGYKTNPLENVTVLQVRPFTSEQVKLFVHNWYLANEIMSSQKDDPGVHEDARHGAEDLLERIRSTSTLADLSVNPLLLTMIATVHRYHSSLPGRRVELYAQICEVFLGKRQQARGLQLDLTPAQKISVLRQLAHAMMMQKIRVIDSSTALDLIAKPLLAVSPKTTGGQFLEDIENSSGLLVEFESSKYSFSHLTFQEYLTSIHLIDKKLEEEILKQVEDPWWHETIRLYCAQTDATQVIATCLDSQSDNALSLAIECMEEAREVSPDVRMYYLDVMEKRIEDIDPETRRLVAAAMLRHRTR
jgi:energy-coupling factor transporter ATP-binding protein EcfA2